MLIKCKKCGKEISDKALNCPSCGSPVKEFVTCNYCGFSNLKSSKFCVECGASLNTKTEKETCKYCHTGIVNEKGYCSNCKSLNRTSVFGSNFLFKTETDNKKKKPLWLKILQIIFCIYLCFGFISCLGAAFTDNEYADTKESTEVYIETEKVESYDTEIDVPETEIKTEETEEQLLTFEEYSAECQEFKYKDVLRNPSDYIGKKAKIEIEISSVHEESLLNAGKYYLGYSKDEEYDMYMGDYYGIFDNRYDTSLKLLEGDVIMVYGEIIEPEYTSSFILNAEELFCIDMKFVELISE